MKYTQEFDVLLMKRNSDGLYFWLINHGSASDWGWTEDKSKAYRVDLWGGELRGAPKPCEYYFENSFRARDIWCKDSVMERNRIVVTTTAESL